MRFILGLAVALTFAQGAEAQVGCDTIKSVIGSVSNNRFPDAKPSIKIEGADVTCGGGETIVTCTLAQIRVCNDSQPTQDEIVAYQTRMQRLTATLPAAMRSCLADREAKPYSSNTSFDGYVGQSGGEQYVKAGEPDVRLVQNISRSISDLQRCEWNSASLDFTIK